MKKRFLFFAFLSCFCISSNTQSFLTPADTLDKKRVIGVTATGATLWVGSTLALQHVWYSDFEKTKFHFFNDSHEWNQMDKMGHFYTANHFAGMVDDLYKWSGVNHKKSALIAAGYSFGYLATFEMLDAYNATWGFSWADIGFNALGTLNYCTQAYLWDEQFVHFKFSVQNSGLADYRPNLLGNDFASRTLKDYNGQTYWMSFNPFHWTKKESKIPKWINLSLGYGINDQLIGDGGTYVVNNGSEQFSFTPYRQYYLSLDVDFQAIPTKSRLLKLLFRSLNVIKVPFPALEFSQGKLSFNPLYF